MSNPFDSDPVARRYADGRPFYHRAALGLAARQLGIGHARLAIDVACGTGLSTRALLELADHVIAIDASAAMLRAAQRHPRARYLVAAAERIPLGDATADLATVGAAFHWFHQPRAFAELTRVLRSGAGLAVYSDFFSGQVSGQPGFSSWLKDSYLPRYPTPPRHGYFDNAAAQAAGFGEISYAEDVIHIPLTRDRLANYLLSQSNAAAAIEAGATSADTLRNQILSETTAFFPGPGDADAVFGIRVWTTVRALNAGDIRGPFGHNYRVTDPQFRVDLYQGTGRDYDQFRVPYPQALIDDLVSRSGANGNGRLLDLACGTGQLSFALRGRFAQTWAVDQEPDMIAVVEEKARAAGATDMHTEVGDVEDLSAPADSFDLVAIGNAFHRLRRDQVAACVLGWLRPGGFLALVWGGSPWGGDAPWQQALAETMQRWQSRVKPNAGERLPAGYAQGRQARPDAAILESAGFELAGRYSFEITHDWTPASVVGFLYSTAVLSRHALGDLAPEFEQDMQRVLEPHARAGELRQPMEFAYDLARRPAA